MASKDINANVTVTTTVKKKVDWVGKLTSRKFWGAVTGFTTSLMYLLNVADTEATKITALIMAGASLIAYMIGEGLADSNKQNLNTGIVELEQTEEGEE
jgi:hypothetical protein